MKMTEIVAHRLLKYFLIFLTLNGLSPFIFTFKRNVLSIRTPRNLLIYSVVVSLLLNTFFICWTVYCAYDYFYKFRTDRLAYLIMTIEFIFGLSKVIVLFTLHNSHHVKIEKLIDQAMKMIKIINKFTLSTTMLNNRVKKMIKRRIFSVLLQIFALILTLPAQSLLGWALFSYPLMLTMLTGSIYIYGLMILSFNSMICINSKLKFIEKSIRINERKSGILSVSWADNSIDEVSAIFDKVYEFTNSVNRMYGMHLTLTLIGSMLLMLCSVKLQLFYLVITHYPNTLT